MPGDFHFRLRSADRFPEVYIQSVFQVRTFLWLYLRLCAPAFEEVEKIAESATAALLAASSALGPRETLKIEAVEVHVRRTLATAALTASEGTSTTAGATLWTTFGVETVLVVHGALLVVAENVISFLNILEPVFRRFIARV